LYIFRSVLFRQSSTEPAKIGAEFSGAKGPHDNDGQRAQRNLPREVRPGHFGGERHDAVRRLRLTTDSLNIRKGPGTDTAVVGVIKDKGVYTIVDEADGPGAPKWGKLKSGAGWISLSSNFVKKM